MRLGLSLEAAVISCYEVGRDGFWLRRYLVGHGITNHAVDSYRVYLKPLDRLSVTSRRQERLAWTLLGMAVPRSQQGV